MESPSRAASRRNSISSTDSASSSSAQALPRFTDLTPARPPTTVPGEEAYVEVSGAKNGGVRLKVDAGTGCGGITWASGEVLARYLAYRHEVDPAYLHQRNILELGSGTGLVGIAAGLLQPETSVWVTDQACLSELMKSNITHNFPSGSSSSVPPVRAAEYNWGEAIPEEIAASEIDMVLAADCVYFEPTFPLLVQTLCDLVPRKPTVEGKPVEVLFCWKKRRKADRHFFSMLKKKFDSVPVDDDRPGERERYTREGISLLRLTRRK